MPEHMIKLDASGGPSGSHRGETTPSGRTLHVFYKHYNIEGRDQKLRPVWFDYEKCFLNLLATIQDYPNIKLYLLMDGSIERNFIGKYRNKYTLHEFKANEARKSVIESLLYVKGVAEQSQDGDLFYLVENDYLHLPSWPSKIEELWSSFANLHYVSLYDHRDKYADMPDRHRYPWSPDYSQLVSQIIMTRSHHWRSTPSTCGTYLSAKEIFLEDVEVPLTMEGDHEKFLHLNKTRGRSVITPIPGLCTHCMEGLLSPTIDWSQVNTQVQYND